MRKNTSIPLLTATILTLLVLLSCLFTVTASGWSNGGFSDNPANPDYGTHDWIAEHALDWLPQEEKQLLLDNKGVYLYGTELPDNGQASDGIGDTSKHHVYYNANGSLQDDSAAVRARDEFAKAVNAFNMGNRSDAAEELGIVAHYIADMAVFGHVMGMSTAWGEEQHHSDYEDYVDTRTNSYQDTFGIYLAYDGALISETAYNAATTLGFNSTFGENGSLNCIWMDANYNWSNPQFANRAGESLNLAVNAVTDVLHAFYAQTSVTIPEFPTAPVLFSFVLPALLYASLVGKKISNKK